MQVMQIIICTNASLNLETKIDGRDHELVFKNVRDMKLLPLFSSGVKDILKKF